MKPLHEYDCEPCPKGAQALGHDEEKALKEQISSLWVIEEKPRRLVLLLETPDFAKALEKAQVIGKMADEQWHHPELTVAFKKLRVEIYTHVINGLRKADFIFAAKVDHLLGL